MLMIFLQFTDIWAQANRRPKSDWYRSSLIKICSLPCIPSASLKGISFNGKVNLFEL